ncbi:Inositol-tetrakisphosphate 1-kinase [Schistosoma japonicum]|nr:Inositol-tetrakisphosphate 1-kinase [Schistosoma japonicum]
MKVVGVWMSEAKADSIGLSTLLHERSDLLFRKINPFTNISEQGPFDVILHKIPEFLNCDSTTSSQNVIKDFINYSETNPNVIYIDPPISLRCLLTRFDQFSMLRDLVGVWSIRKEIFVPKFCLLSKNDPTELCEAGISYPVVCKSLMAHGQDSVHEIAIVFDDSGLNNLRYPIFVQQFINHNGKVLKLFVIGDYSCVTEVPSIKNQENSKCGIVAHSCGFFSMLKIKSLVKITLILSVHPPNKLKFLDSTYS